MFVFSFISVVAETAALIAAGSGESPMTVCARVENCTTPISTCLADTLKPSTTALVKESARCQSSPAACQLADE